VSAEPERDDAQALEGRWVAVVRVGRELLAVGPLSQQVAVMGVLGMVEAYVGVERVGVAELVGPGDAAARVAAARSKGPDAAGVLRPPPRREEDTL